ncbi:hypothetical protein [Mucilaginibacter sp. KACC 22063]|uniref:hypothetical protein n=1 Tax=Mucilaginibacter sp. KACC 22063 TaxID=3025666 RepID=UPI00236523A6|nr:hypothetical protein [Mucilaginibacter sp. KACC 22063]WDF56025.1 hypothetical protein PQ461_02990 [Mucilaginibacter sp. KACC 22063]
MNITEDLINRYLQFKCSEEERLFLNKYFEAHPQELEKYLDESAFLNNPDTKPLDSDTTEKMLRAIERKINRDKD